MKRNKLWILGGMLVLLLGIACIAVNIWVVATEKGAWSPTLLVSGAVFILFGRSVVKKALKRRGNSHGVPGTCFSPGGDGWGDELFKKGEE